MILFVGDKEVGYWINEPAALNHQSVEYIDAALNVKEQANDILRLREERINFVVYDLAQYGVNATEIADEIYNIYKAGNAEPIFLATSFLPSSDLIIQLQKRGFRKFIFAFHDKEKKDELEKCMNGYYETKLPEKLMDIPKADQINMERRRITVGVSGACERMGTTTQAMQVVKHLLYCGEKACYIELNSSGFVELLAEIYTPDEIDKEKGKVRFANIDMFYRQDLIPEILHMDYKYFVYDYGAVTNKEFNKISYLEKDIRLMILGSNPGELQKSTEVINSIFYQDIHYIFNLTAEADRRDLLDMMDDKSNNTYFMEYIPDMFVYRPTDYYTSLFPTAIAKDESNNKKNKWWKRVWENTKKA